MNENSHILYRINARDEIVSVNDEWSRLAVENGAPDIISDKILGRSLWSFISAGTIKDFYRQIVRRARAGHLIRFNLRCDCPEFRRLLEMSIRPGENGDLQFQSRPIWSRAHESSIVAEQKPACGEILTACSWCRKINVAGENWQEADQAAVSLGLFELKKPPQISHGMCADCHREVTKEYRSRSGGA